MLLLLLLAVAGDTSIHRHRDYVAPIERYVDSMAQDGGYDDGYYRMMEHRHLHEKSLPMFDIRPTYFDSPFVKPHDWC